MQVEIAPMVEDFLMRDEWVENGVLLQHANQWSRLFYQQLQEARLVGPDGEPLEKLTVERDGALPIGDSTYDCLIFTLSRTGYQPKAALFPCETVQSRHGESQDLLFRGHHFIEGVLMPLAQSPWLEVQP